MHANTLRYLERLYRLDSMIDCELDLMDDDAQVLVDASAIYARTNAYATDVVLAFEAFACALGDLREASCGTTGAEMPEAATGVADAHEALRRALAAARLRGDA